MKSSLVCLKVSIKKSPIHGYGVFAEQDIAAGDIIEECHTLLSESMVDNFERYFFNASKKFGLPLGYGAIYNHSPHPNASSTWDREYNLIVIQAEKKIKKGDEIYISYGNDYFTSRNIEIKADSFRSKLRRMRPLIAMIMRFVVVTAGLYYLLYVCEY